ncbi:hypothetical protein ABZ725_50345 [Streptomyces sp. NPDC006872]|uniref:hypothetical protein n=1 Tax=Streptomyces sp. NPDC006872 TaxID=3155720 RepID=UPI0033D7D54B
MPDTADLSMIATSALPAAFTFLFQRLDVALDRWRSGIEPEAEREPDVPAELVGGLQLPLRIDTGRLADQAPALEILALAMAAYGQQPSLITGDNTKLLETLARVRTALEDVYGQRFTFQGETRGKSGPLADHQYGSVAGEVTGLAAGEAIRGSVVSRIRAERVEPQGRITGMKAPVIEDRG